MNGNDERTREGQGVATMPLAEWLHLAATPTFLLMALLSATAGAGSMDMLCPAIHGTSSLGGMTMMYVLMAVFHAAPWLQRGARWWRRLH